MGWYRIGITISDDMFEDVNIHNENGEWQALFGVAILPEYRKKDM